MEPTPAPTIEQPPTMVPAPLFWSASLLVIGLEALRGIVDTILTLDRPAAEAWRRHAVRCDARGVRAWPPPWRKDG